MVLLDRKTSQEVLPVAGVLLPDPLVFCFLIGKIEKEKAMEEAYCLAALMRLGVGCSALALKEGIMSLVCVKHKNNFGAANLCHKHKSQNTCCEWAGGTFFPVVLLCQFFGFWQEIGFGVTYLHI